jgi:hypothetical protein
MAKKKNGSRKSRKVPILATGGTILTGINIYNKYQAARPGLKAEDFVTSFTGLSMASGKGFSLSKTVYNLAPAIIGVGGSMLASKLGMNRYMAKVPFFKW